MILTAREAVILYHMATGLDNQQIADRLGNARDTVKNHLTEIYAKLGVSGRTQAAVICLYGVEPGYRVEVVDERSGRG